MPRKITAGELGVVLLVLALIIAGYYWMGHGDGCAIGRRCGGLLNGPD